MAEVFLAIFCGALAALAAVLLVLRRRNLDQIEALRRDLAAAADTAGEPAALRERLAQLERERTEQARQFELAAREMESFSYSVSHDLRAPLRVVDGFAAIILEDYGARLDTIGREHVQRIAAAAEELADELRASDVRRKVEFRIEPGLRADGDPTLLRLVLQNLLGNGYKFTGQAEQAIVEFGHHVVDGNDVFFVRDNGAGFDMRFAGQLFGLFQRFHSQSDFPGTGVGLATVQRIVRKHGGRIWAEAEPGRGACFYFTLPRVPAINLVARV